MSTSYTAYIAWGFPVPDNMYTEELEDLYGTSSIRWIGNEDLFFGYVRLSVEDFSRGDQMASIKLPLSVPPKKRERVEAAAKWLSEQTGKEYPCSWHLLGDAW